MPSIKNDDLVQFISPWVIDNATKSNQDTANNLHAKLLTKFPSDKISVFCWAKNEMSCTSTKDSKGWFQFKYANNSAYGKDTMILLN